MSRPVKKMFRNKDQLANAWAKSLQLAQENHISVKENVLAGPLEASFERATMTSAWDEPVQTKTIWMPAGWLRNELNLCLLLHELGHHFRGVHARNASQLHHNPKAPVSRNLETYRHCSAVLASELSAWDWAIYAAAGFEGCASLDIMHQTAMRCTRTYMQSYAAEWGSVLHDIKMKEELLEEEKCK